MLIDLQHVSLRGAERDLIEDLSLTISSGDRIGIVGINGAGKSSLLRILAGVLTPSSGQVKRAQHCSVGFLEQIPELPSGTVRDAIGTGWEAERALDQLGMLGAIEHATGHLSGGQAKRVALTRLFATPHDVLILDEPTNHLDLGAIEWLEAQLLACKGAVVLVSHDRFLLDKVTTRMIEIDRGKTYVHTGGYGRLLELQAEREEHAVSAEQTRRNLARRELAWLRRGVKARSTKPQARIDAAQRLLEARPEAAAREGTLDLSTETPRLGNTVVKAHRVSFSFDPSRPLLHEVDLDLGPGDRIGIVGPNGAGKSTLLDLLSLHLVPSEGNVKHGPTVVASYFEQDGGALDLTKTVQELVAGPDRSPGALSDVALMKRFWFSGALPFSKAGDLSGGERRRLQLLLALAARPNVLFLDEPTNDLDLETIRLLEDFLRQWPGTLVVVSHDRTFLSRTTDRLLEVHHDGRVVDLPGGIDAWIARAAGIDMTRVENSEHPDSSGATTAKASTDPSKGRLLREAEKEMSRLERRTTSLWEKLAAETDEAEQRRLDRELKEVRVQLAVAEDRWLSLSE